MCMIKIFDNKKKIIEQWNSQAFDNDVSISIMIHFIILSIVIIEICLSPNQIKIFELFNWYVILSIVICYSIQFNYVKDI